MSLDLVFAFGSIAWLMGVGACAFGISNARTRTLLANAMPLTVVGACVVLAPTLGPSLRLALASLVLLFTFKASALLKGERTKPSIGILFYCFAWPGIDVQPFRATLRPQIEDGKRFGQGMFCFLTGATFLLLAAGFLPVLSVEVATWIGVASLLLAVHFGISNILSELTFAIGFGVTPLFDAPHKANSLSNFWSQRWNRPFVEMNKIFFLPSLIRRLGMKKAIFVVFLISGFLHELAISYPAGGGYGLPLLYFAVQGGLVLVERRAKLRGSLWVALAVLLPVPLLLHGAFRQKLILPFLQWIHSLIAHMDIPTAMGILVIVLGIAQFCVLAASFQVPTRLRWREELPRLSSLNQKLMWTYGSFIVYTIVAMGVLTLVLREDILQGTRAGNTLALFIFLFWGLRLLTDTFYFKSSDWPKKPFMQIGHTLLNCLFTFVFLGYGTILAWHLYQRFTV